MNLVRKMISKFSQFSRADLKGNIYGRRICSPPVYGKRHNAQILSCRDALLSRPVTAGSRRSLPVPRILWHHGTAVHADAGVQQAPLRAEQDAADAGRRISAFVQDIHSAAAAAASAKQAAAKGSLLLAVPAIQFGIGVGIEQGSIFVVVQRDRYLKRDSGNDVPRDREVSSFTLSAVVLCSLLCCGCCCR